jgi:hypothetical protein
VAGVLAGSLAAEARNWVLADASGCVVFCSTFAAAGSAAACDMALAVAASGVVRAAVVPGSALAVAASGVVRAAAVPGSALAVAASVVTGFGAAPGGAPSERAWDAGLAPWLAALWFGAAVGAAVLAPGLAAVVGGGAGLATGAPGL